MKLKFSFFLILLLAMFVSLQTFAQKHAQPENFSDSLKFAFADFKKELYDSAIQKFQSIPKYDSLYAIAQHELGLTYIHSGKFNEGYTVFDSLRYAETNFGNNIYVGLSLALDSLGKKQEALAVLDTGIAKYPHHYLLYFNKAEILQKMKQYQQAIIEYQNAILYAPGHVKSHIQLGLLAAQEGKHTRAMLSLMYAALMSPNSQLTLDIYKYIELVAGLNIEIDKKNISFGDDALFADIDLIFERQIALNKKVPDASKINIAATKQFQMICEALSKHSIYTTENQDFWLQMYVPLFANIFKTHNYAGMIYFSMQDIQEKNIQKYIKKGKKDLDSFSTWLRKQYPTYRNHRYVMHNDMWQKMSFYFNDDGTIGGIGKVDENGDNDSIWNYFHANGSVKIIGAYKKGEREGLWKWFFEEKHAIKETIMYRDGKKEGAHTEYRKDGSVTFIANSENDEYNGFATYLYASGDTLSRMMLKNGKRDSLLLVYHENGSLKTKAFFKADDLHGTYTAFYENDSIQYTEEYKNKMINGYYIRYFYNGALKQKTYAVNNKFNGINEEYNINGTLWRTGSYKNNNAIGTWTTYYSNGVKNEEIKFDEREKINATCTAFDIDGAKYLKEEYKNGELFRITYFDKQGNNFFKSKKSGKSIQYKSFLPDGTVQIEGILVNDEKHDIWQHYTEYGSLNYTEFFDFGTQLNKEIEYFTFGNKKSVNEYKDNKLHGLSLSYYPNNTIKQEGYFTEGKMTGTWYEYYIHGEPHNKAYYANGDLVYYCTYSVTGKIINEYFYENNSIKSQKKYDSTGVVQQEFPLLHGEIVIYEPHSKKILSKIMYKNGKAEGAAEWYYSNGKIETRGSYCNGKRHGVWEWYSVQGNLITKATYIYGDKHGVLYRYYEVNGILRATELYEYGKQQGEETYYHVNGEKHYTSNYVDDKIHGEVRYFSEAGNVYQIRYYNQGKIIGHSYLDKDGNAVPMIPFNGSAKVEFYYSNGTKSLEWERENGRLTGEYIRYAENGTIMEHETYKNHEKHGKSMRMTSSEHLNQEMNYFYGQLHGVSKKYYSNGALFLETTYYNDEKHGSEKEYNTHGKLKYIREYYDGTLVHEKIVGN